jgi:hypothetical protein
MLTILEDIALFQLIRKIADLYLTADKTLGSIIIRSINGNGRVIVYLTFDAVHEAFVQPVD